MSKKRRHLSFSRRLKRLTRPLRYALMPRLLSGFRHLARLMPCAMALRVGRWAGRLAALVDRRGRSRARRQLLQTGIAATPADARRISRQIYENLGMNALEWMHSLDWSAEAFRDLVVLDNMEILEEALTHKDGFIFISAHMGNWEYLPRTFHAYTGRSLAAVMAPPRNEVFTRWLIDMRQAHGHSKIIPSTEALAIVRHLKRGGILALMVDQDSTRSRGIFVDFFGRPAYTPAGPAHLAHRTGRPIVPAIIVRESAWPPRHRVIFAPPIMPDPQLGDEADILRLTQAYTRVLEDWIRAYPEQWVWIHDRWRHQPGEKIRVRSAESKE